MKKLLIIADGDIANRFVERVSDTYSDINMFDIIYYNDSIKENDAIQCQFYKFDPTSFSKLEAIFSSQYYTAYIVMNSSSDIQAVYHNLRTLDRNLLIYVLDNGHLELPDNDNYLRRILSRELLANRLMTVVPNVPVSAQYVGLGQGEIIEAKVPFGSSFSYRHIGAIEQKKWQIGAIYRKNELILPNPALMVRPDDNILLIGQPSILKTVYKAIKLETGQFPVPYGRNIYVILDLSKKRAEKALVELESALSIHKRIKNKILFIKVINPDDLKLLSKLRSITQKDIDVDIEYRTFHIEKEFANELPRLNIGLFLVSSDLFNNKLHRSLLYETKKPIWKLGVKPAKDIRRASVLLSSNPNLEQLGSTLFDLSIQLSLEISLYPGGINEDEEQVNIEHFENLSQMHARTINIVKNEINPVVALRQQQDTLLFFPFEHSLIKRNWLDMFIPEHIERMNLFLDHHHQIFIPIL
ncbi:MAG: hypothetical protein LBN32_03895 [Helicobacteraceae bacterium]|jgi:hypothetical protein|nr:hypothetical protein [Helicobacteraceae bacterium]